MKSKKLFKNKCLLALCGTLAILSLCGGIATTAVQKVDALEQTEIKTAVESYTSVLPEGVYLDDYTVLDLGAKTIAENAYDQYDMGTHQAVRFQYNKTSSPWGLYFGVYNDTRGYHQPYNSGYFYLWNGNGNTLTYTIFGKTVTGSMPSWMERADLGDYDIEYGGVKCYSDSGSYAGEYYYLEVDGCILSEYFHENKNPNAITTNLFTISPTGAISISPYGKGKDISANTYVELPQSAFIDEKPIPTVYYAVEKEDKTYAQVVPSKYYSVTYSEDLTALTGTATITFKDKYSGTVQSSYALIPPLDVSKYSVTLLENVIEYKGVPVCPKVVSVNCEGEAISPENYTVSYKNNDGIGTGEVVITFKNGYHGELTAYFSIIKESIPIESIPEAAYMGAYEIADLSDFAGANEVHLNSQWQYFYQMSGAQGVRFTAEIVKNPSWATEFMIHVPESTSAERFWYKGYRLTISKTQKLSLYAGNNVVAEADLPSWGYFTEIGNVVDVEFAVAPLYLKSNGEYYGDYLYLRLNEVKLMGKVLVGSSLPEKGGFVCLGSYLDADIKLTDILPQEVGEQLNISCPSVEYTGEKVTPIPTISYEKQIKNSIYTVVLDPCDYTLSYENNTEVGTGIVHITLQGKYEGKASATFSIVQAEEETPPKQDEELDKDSSSSSSNENEGQDSVRWYILAIPAIILVGLGVVLFVLFKNRR